MQKITPCLWFDTEAEAAAELYVSLFADAKILDVTHYGEAAPRPAGTVMTVSFTLEGQEYLALNGGPEFPFTEAARRPGPGAGPARDGRDAADGQARHRGAGEGGRRGLTDERLRAGGRRPGGR